MSLFRECIRLTVVCSVLSFAANASAQPAATQPAKPLDYWDMAVNAGMSAVRLTDDQAAKLKPILEAFAKEAKESEKAFQAKWKPINEKMRAIADRTSPEYKALQAESNTLREDLNKERAQRRGRLFPELFKVLAPGQKLRFEDRTGFWTGDTAAFTRCLAAGLIEQLAPKVELTDQQYEQIMAKLVPMQEKFDADMEKAKETDPVKRSQWRSAFNKNAREVIYSFLTDEQKKLATANRTERFKKEVENFPQQISPFFDTLNPTPDQKKQIAKIIAAACEGAIKQGPDEGAGHFNMWGSQYFKDIRDLLTPEQQRQLPPEF